MSVIERAISIRLYPVPSNEDAISDIGIVSMILIFKCNFFGLTDHEYSCIAQFVLIVCSLVIQH